MDNTSASQPYDFGKALILPSNNLQTERLGDTYANTQGAHTPLQSRAHAKENGLSINRMGSTYNVLHLAASAVT
eukprot:scaffold127622_cov30-Tisochrysis_lutea.AAC.2